MPSLCQNLQTSYAHLRTLTDEFTTEYARVKDSGDLTEVRQLKRTLEEARDALLEQLCVFKVPDATNPYHEALLEAGLEADKTTERQETRLDLRKEIARQLAVYREAKDEEGRPVLEEWVKDIQENEGLIYAQVVKDRARIVERIKEGMIPVLMPSRTIQERTWREALSSLKPVWFEGGVKQTVNDPFVIYHYKSEKMNQSGFFKNIPDRPYLVWVKPTQQPSPLTVNKSFYDQEIYYSQLVMDHPNLYDRTDLIPTEYCALQAIFTSLVKVHYQDLKGATHDPAQIRPLDHETYTRFLSAGLFSHLEAPCVDFAVPADRLGFLSGRNYEHVLDGFRPASRS